MLTKTDIEKYFTAEKQESILFLIIGIVAVVAALSFFIFYKTNFWRGIAIPLAVIGLIQIIVGYTIYTRSDADRVRVVYALDMNPDAIKYNELPRMNVVMKNFMVYRYVEIALIMLSVVLFFITKNNAVTENSWQGNAFWRGIAIALFIQSLLMLGADFFAEKRGAIYTQQLKQVVSK